jgi:hypothetical protein
MKSLKNETNLVPAFAYFATLGSQSCQNWQPLDTRCHVQKMNQLKVFENQLFCPKT